MLYGARLHKVETEFSRTIYDIAILDSIVLHEQKCFCHVSVNI